MRIRCKPYNNQKRSQTPNTVWRIFYFIVTIMIILLGKKKKKKTIFTIENIFMCEKQKRANPRNIIVIILRILFGTYHLCSGVGVQRVSSSHFQRVRSRFLYRFYFSSSVYIYVSKTRSNHQSGEKVNAAQSHWVYVLQKKV